MKSGFPELSWERICLQYRRPQFDSWAGKIHWRQKWLHTAVFWPGKFHRLYTPWVAKSWTWLSDFHFTFTYTWKKLQDQAISSVQSLSCVRLFATPWITARKASLSITNSWSSPKLMSIKLLMPSSHLILCCPLLLLPSIFPSLRVLSSESLLYIRWPSIGASASASVLPMNIQNWFPLRLTGLISLLFKGLSKDFSSTTVQKH